ncbi:hypothetical protein NP233_g1165 [Leucocoprinus birnbaumii]|uniref:P-loop containing nucleoside triphosphate hydrolase protein n=1 Tax=Leucocoprinus birnbaumii TaxID=56174 RepID=A0AAD5W0J3_9AGAR|nr:hypothetical protein NP233_g1165 [Leucocoprinus birnbaumii]
MTTQETPTRVITVGIGGATSSGKTILAKHLQNCLHNSYIIHQDDFVPPAEKLPIDEEYGFTDWDNPPGAIDWDRMAAFLSGLKQTGNVPADHQSFDNYNNTTPVPIEDQAIEEWRRKSERIASDHLEKYGEKLVWALIDGFLLYWDEARTTISSAVCLKSWLIMLKRIVSDLDMRVFLRVPEDVARKRREARAYYTPEGDTWHDPPHYWEKIVWPAYIRAHQHMFEGEDVVNGSPNGKVKDLILFESTETKMEDMVNVVMQRALSFNVNAK